MDKVISAQSYWEWFFNKHQDPEPFRSFISSDPILTKIFNFAAVPNIFLAIETDYPFDEKLAELSTITKEDIAHLSDLNIVTVYSGDQQEIAEWLDFLDNLFGLVRTTLRHYEHCQLQLNMDSGVLKEDTIQHFKKYFSVCGAGVSEDKKGQRYTWQRMGHVLKNAELFIKDIPGDTPETVCEVHYFLEPTTEDIEDIKNALDRGSVLNYRQYRHPTIEKICYGGYYSKLDKQGKHEGENHLVEFYFDIKKLGRFNYSIRKRYEPMLRKCGKTKKRMEWEPEDRIHQSEIKLLELIESFDKAGGLSPAAYFFANLEHFMDTLRENESVQIRKKRYRKAALEESGGSLNHSNSEGLDNSEKIFEDLHHEIKPESEYAKFESGQVVRKVFDSVCSDEIDRKILESCLDNPESYKKTGSINYASIGRQFEKDGIFVKRRLNKIMERVQRHPQLKDLLK